jgi:hypothetical protein
MSKMVCIAIYKMCHAELPIRLRIMQRQDLSRAYIKACAIPFLLEAGQASPRPSSEIFFELFVK